MRKLFLLMLVLLSVAVCGLPALAEGDPFMEAAVLVPGDGDMPFADALAIARAAYAEAMGEAYQDLYEDQMTACFVSVERDGETQRMWRIALCNGGRDMSTVCAVMVLSPSGDVAGIEQYDWYARREAWEAEKGPYPTWTVEDKSLFYEVYSRMSGDLYADAVPQAHDMTGEEAVAAAKKVLVEEKNADPEELETLMMGVIFQKKLHDNAEDFYQKDFWAVTFVVENPDRPTGYEEVYQANIASPDGEVYLLYNMHEDGRGNG